MQDRNQRNLILLSLTINEMKFTIRITLQNYVNLSQNNLIIGNIQLLLHII